MDLSQTKSHFPKDYSGNVSSRLGFTPAAGGTALFGQQETHMINSAIRFVALAISLASLFAAPPVISAFAAGGGGGGGGGGDPYGSTYTSTPPSSPDTKATRTTHKGKKKSDKQSSFDDPGIA